jgi:hypothetical protein
MMGVPIPEALVKAADPKTHTDMAAAEAAAAVAHTV